MKKTIKVMALGLKGNWRYIFSYVIMVFLITCISIGSTMIQKEIINTAERDIATGVMSRSFATKCMFFSVMLFLVNASKFLHTYVHNLVQQNIEMKLKKCLMFSSYRTPHDEYYKTDFQKKYSFVCKNMQNISRYILSILNTVFNHGVSIVAISVIFLLYVPELFVYMVAIAIIYALTYIYTSKKKYNMSKEQIGYQREADYYSDVLMKKEYAKEIRLYGVQHTFIDMWRNIYQNLFCERYKLANKNNRLTMLTELISFFCQAGVMFLLVYKCFFRVINLGEFVLLFGLLEKSKANIMFVVNNIIAGTYEVSLYMNDYADFVFPISKAENKQIQECHVGEETKIYGEFQQVSIENVSYKYPNGEKEAVHNVSLNINKGEIVCILGYNGSGKTTLVKMLSGILSPHSGLLKINGIECSSCRKEDIYQYYGIAFQDFPRYSLSMHDTVGIGKIERLNDENEVNDAYNRTGLNAFIENNFSDDEVILGKEYDAKGIDLSGGEWQQVILTQAHMGKPDVLIFDEPTASLDPIEEMKILENLRMQIEDRTAVLISHRIGFARIADKIVVIDEGRLVEQGSHDELLSQKGIYYKMFTTLQELYV